jgi:uncharacterized protein (TIGR02246 family)
MSASHRAIVDKSNAAFASGNTEAFIALCADDVEFTMVGHSKVIGKDALRQMMSSMQSEPPKISVDHVIADGAMVVAKGTMTMKDKAEGPDEHYTYADVYQIRNDKIVALTAFVMKTVATPPATTV